MLTVSALAVDCPSQLICTWIFMCSMTKLREHSREICPDEPNSCWRYRHWYRHRQYSPLRPPYIPLHLHIIIITVVAIVTIISILFCLLWQTISPLTRSIYHSMQLHFTSITDTHRCFTICSWVNIFLFLGQGFRFNPFNCLGRSFSWAEKKYKE